MHLPCIRPTHAWSRAPHRVPCTLLGVILSEEPWIILEHSLEKVIKIKNNLGVTTTKLSQILADVGDKFRKTLGWVTWSRWLSFWNLATALYANMWISPNYYHPFLYSTLAQGENCDQINSFYIYQTLLISNKEMIVGSWKETKRHIKIILVDSCLGKFQCKFKAEIL